MLKKKKQQGIVLTNRISAGMQQMCYGCCYLYKYTETKAVAPTREGSWELNRRKTLPVLFDGLLCHHFVSTCVFVCSTAAVAEQRGKEKEVQPPFTANDTDARSY